MTVEQSIEEIMRRGYRINNLCQREDGVWAANCKGPGDFAEFGSGDSPAEAFTALLAKLPTLPKRSTNGGGVFG